MSCMYTFVTFGAALGVTDSILSEFSIILQGLGSSGTLPHKGPKILRILW